MARLLRIEYAGAAYPVTARGNQCRAIFKNEAYRRRFASSPGEAWDKTGWCIHAAAGQDTNARRSPRLTTFFEVTKRINT
jgi:hypothetical protein